MRNVLDLRKQTGNDVPPAGWPFSKWTEGHKGQKPPRTPKIRDPTATVFIFMHLFICQKDQSRLHVCSPRPRRIAISLVCPLC